MRLEKDLYITEVRISKTVNAPFVIDAVDRYQNRLTLNEENLNAWMINPSKEIIGKSIIVTLESKHSSEEFDAMDVLIDEIERAEKRKFKQIPKFTFVDEVELILRLKTPRHDSMSLPCPNFELIFDLNESEYYELIDLAPDTIFSISCRIR